MEDGRYFLLLEQIARADREQLLIFRQRLRDEERPDDPDVRDLLESAAMREASLR